ncbi:MAG: DUF4097 family beta strand repeat-containing protein [Bacillota bacterium]
MSVPEHQAPMNKKKPDRRMTVERHPGLLRRRRKFPALLLASLFPGMGHVYLGLYRKGITFIMLLMLDISALLYFSSIGMQINVPLLILLGLLIPLGYFYNVFDVLQAADYILSRRRRGVTATLSTHDAEVTRGRNPFHGERGLSFGLMLVGGGVLLILFHQKPQWLQIGIRNYGTMISAVLLMICGIVIAMKHKIRVGRYTAAVLLIFTGALLLIDEWNGTDHIFLLLKWWPLLFIIWGIEYLLRYTISRALGRQSNFRLRPDFRGVVLSVCLVASVFVVSQQEHFLHLWNRVSLNLTAAGVDYSEAADNKFQKETLEIPVALNTGKIIVDHLNGDITMYRSDVEDIVVNTEVWVDQEEKGLAEAIAEQSTVEADEGNTVVIRAKGKAYGQSGKRQPKMNMEIVIPDDRRFNLELRTMNGDLSLLNVEAIDNISLESGNGQITLSRVYGDVTGKTLNGDINVRGVTGDIKLSTNRGGVKAYDVSGKGSLTTQVGNIIVKRFAKEIDVKTRNGNIMVYGAEENLTAESLNGSIDVRSGTIGGDWSVYSAVGVMNVRIPVEGDYELEGVISYGSIQTELPNLTVEQKSIIGTAGTGEYSIKIEGNSDLNIYKTYPTVENRRTERGLTPLPH